MKDALQLTDLSFLHRDLSRKVLTFDQHSTMFTASPPRAVSLYFVIMSAPVSRIVLMTLSRLTWCVPSPRSAMRAALIAFTDAIALRSIHFWYDVPYALDALWRSTLVQAVLSLLWSSLALATMAYANRRQWRVPWMAGAALLGVVVAKLFLVELAQVGTITRIVSFIGVGLLLLLIGYLAPVPPRRKDELS